MLTLDGVDVMGERLAGEVAIFLDIVKLTDSVYYSRRPIDFTYILAN